ncbi:MAG: tRNA (adenosine(37)-N6)-dimethylallyltransferase MiaA [Clostridia bacterium]|nr:tRNA (adenosine(37)-N6)-dimethylallyltransferase MiaA [Clostridia bacterium]
MSKPKVIVIGGATASGKTGLSIELAKKINGEIISADSMQIYKDMDIGTAKVTTEEMQGVKHHLIDFVSPSHRYSVADFKKDADELIEAILKRGKVPIIVGGTGLYIDSLIYSIEFGNVEVDEKYRNVLESIAQNEGLQNLYNLATEIDPDAMEKISKNDKKRIFRVLELYRQTGKTKTEQEKNSRKNEVKYDFKVFAISMDREKLYERINTRVDLMIERGLVDEVKGIINKYDEFPTAMQGLGYKEVVQFLEGKCSKQEMIDKIKIETRHYAKRQLTWFRKNKELVWLDANNSLDENINIILEAVSEKER